MNRRKSFSTITLSLAAFAGLSQPLPAVSVAGVTFHKDIEPLLQAHCQTCHRAGEIAPMSLTTYSETRKWAKAIAEAVLLRKMPPWFADPSAHQKYRNDLSLSPADIDKINTWVKSGAPEGDANEAPAPRRFIDGWNIGQPDLVVQMKQPYPIPATGTIEYLYFIVPSGLAQDIWVHAAEVRPGNPAALHHANLFVRTPGSKWLAGYPKGVAFVPEARPGTKHRSSDGDRILEGTHADEWITAYAPGHRPWRVPDDTAFLVKAGSDFILQLHYTSKGAPATDQTKIGLVFAKTPPAKRGYVAGIANESFVIPPGDGNYRDHAVVTLGSDVTLISATSHMHLRGKAMDMRAVYPTGESEMLFSIPRFDFNWQQMYEFETPKVLPRGTRLEVTAAFDNSPNNPFNPDPASEVRWGDQVWEEMLLGVVIMQIDPHADLDRIFAKPLIAAAR